jgi:enterochelin esterase-like enzyme
MTGEHDFSWNGTLELHNKLEQAEIRHHYESWAPPCYHNEKWWKQQLPHILNKIFKS